MFREWEGGPCSCGGASKGEEKWEVRSERFVSHNGVCHAEPPSHFENFDFEVEIGSHWMVLNSRVI